MILWLFLLVLQLFGEIDNTLILGSKTLREKVGIDIATSLKGKAHGGDRSSVEMPEDVGFRRGT